MRFLIGFVLRHSLLAIILVMAVTVFFAWEAADISVDPNTDRMFPDDKERAAELSQKFGVEESAQQLLIIGVKDPSALSTDKLKLFYDVIEDISAYPEIASVISPFNFLVFTRDGGKLAVTTTAPGGIPPNSEEELSIFRERLLNNPNALNTVVAEEGEVLCAIFENDRIIDAAEFMERLSVELNLLEQEFDEVYYTGEIPFTDRTGTYIERDFRVLLILAVIVMIFVFFLSFRTKRGFLLPLLVIAIGAVWSIGFMNLMNWSLTVVSITIPPLVLAIGSSYSIHILNEYYRHALVAENNPDWLLESVINVNKTILLAALTTIIGFVSLMTSSIVPVRQFSAAVIVGISACAFMSIFLLPALLGRMRFPSEKRITALKESRLTIAIDRLGAFVYKRTLLLTVILAVIFTVFMVTKSNIIYQADYLAYYPSDDPLITNNKKLLEYTGGAQAINVSIKAKEAGGKFFLEPENLEMISELEAELSGVKDVQKITSFSTMLKYANQVMTGGDEVPKNRGLILLLSRYLKLINGQGIDGAFISDDYNIMSIYMTVYNAEDRKFVTEKDIEKLNSEISAILGKYLPDDVESEVWGDTILFLASSRIMSREQVFSTLLSLLMVFLVTSFIFKSVKFGLISLIPLCFGIMCYYITVSLLRIPMDMTTIIVTNIAIGVGVDDSIHFLLQFRKQYKHDLPIALKNTFSIAGRPIALTTISIVSGLAILCFAQFKPVMHFGLLVSVCLLAAMIGTFLFLPVFIKLIHLKAFENPTGRS